ncbi:MAG: GNAT family N-acetyltransferase, partial [Actinomycetota bacterium]|nr:GNAT family N-acetyltransferase [Actinomycetota bacterium]
EDLFSRLSDRSVRMRFHGAMGSGIDLRRFTEVDYKDSFGLVAETSRNGGPRIVALASYVLTGEKKAEAAVVVDDPLQGKGVGSILVEHLAEAASAAGIETFEAEVMAANSDMLEVVRGLSLPFTSNLESGVVHVEFPTSPTEEAIAAFEKREAVAAAAAVQAFLKPRSVAVIGASRSRGSIGGELFRNLLQTGFEGPVYPVNPKTDVVQSVAAYPTVLEIPGPVDLAVIVVPAPLVPETVSQSAEKGVRALLIISAGFAEVGHEGARLQDQVLEIARRNGMRIIGPNCMGLVNTDPNVRLNATFSPVAPPPGRLAFSSQSGALGIAVMERAGALGLGMSGFVSVGNKADISGNDLLQYWEQDQKTDVILLYLESFGNPRKFARIARRIARTKPIVAVKSGRSEAGARAAASHTGSMVAGDVAVDALFRQAGVIRTDTLEELFDVASLLAHQPLPPGDRVAILTNAGGLGILCADACEASGLRIPQLSDKTVERLGSFLPAEAGLGNPVDMIASASAEDYGRALEALADDADVDAIIVIFIPPLVTRAEDVAAALVESAEKLNHKTVLSCFLGIQGAHQQLQRKDTVIPSHAFPESAARALGRVVEYAGWRARPAGRVPTFKNTDRSGAHYLVAEALRQSRSWLTARQVSDLLDCYGIKSVPNRMVRDVSDIARAAAELTPPLVVKVESRTILHKTEVGGVLLNLQTPEEAGAAGEELLDSLSAMGRADETEGWLVQEMVSAEGAEMFVGMTLDPLFGPLLACGAGGTMVELMRDVSVRITPLTDVEAEEMLRSLKSWPLFEGYRGAPPIDAAALQDLLLRLSTMVEDLPHVAELDLNPVFVYEEGKGCVVLDARIRVTKPVPAAPRGARTVRRG